MAISETNSVSPDEPEKLEDRLWLGSLEPGKISPAILFGHADADGYLVTEQSRTNLTAHGVPVKKIMVGPETRNYRFWEQSFSSFNFRRFRLAVTVDIAFSFKVPDDSLQAVLYVADRYPGTQFIIIDHHPLQNPQMPRSNLKLIAVDSVHSCCLGTPSDELMVVAEMCDGETKSVLSKASDQDIKRAVGVRRAAAAVGGIAPSNLLEYLRRRRWDFFEALSEEPTEYHKAVRGRRTKRGLKSPLLEAAKAGWLSTRAIRALAQQM